ncbi:germin-like protein subfamily 3 member 4 [Abrus precatorius]|uniref:Germin-like protein n=1 Tax=Abrus precatorius TaxID=3816 RepID=A0A8B8LYX5_ABRPR|nr:germin-like protein subfamily 3 member 4 [Abrus precatorius]
MKIKFHSSLFFMFLIAFTSIKVSLADCDNLQDTCPTASPDKHAIFINGLPCENPLNKSAHDFKSMELSNGGTRDAFGSSMKIVTASKFTGLNTLGISVGRIDIEVDGLVNLHNHPRATEMIFVREGVLEAAFLDTQNQLFQKALKAGDVFVIPKGLFHFFLNRGVQVATLFSVFNSQNPGLGSLTSFPSTVESTEKLKRKLISLYDSQVDGVNDLTSAVLDIMYS